MTIFGLLVVLAVSAPARLDRGLGDPPPELERATPLDTVQGFLKSAHAGDYTTAAHYLWLDHLPEREQAVQGPRLARHLRFVLDHQPLDLTHVSKNPEGDPEKRNSDDLGVIPLRKVKVPIRVVRVRSGAEEVWAFDRETVRSIEPLFEEYGPPFGDRMPEMLIKRTFFDMELWQWLGLVLLGVFAFPLGWLTERLLLAVGRRMTWLDRLKWNDSFLRAGRGSLRLWLIAGLLALGGSVLALPPSLRGAIDLIARSLAIVAFGWFTLRFIDEGTKFLLRRFELEREVNPLRARGMETQLSILARVLIIVAYLLTGALLLLQFESVRSLGVSLLASAGVAGLVIGFAAQKSIATLVSGIQLSIAQPIRIGDKVVLEGEFGTIEEIHLTHVVVRLWDLRRLVLPIGYFLEKPFQNWSKNGTNLLGAITLQIDYTADVNVFRAEVERILANEGRALWDGKTQNVQIVDATERTQTLRVLVSSRDASDTWDLRCLVREQLISFLRRNPRWLPMQRTLPVPLEMDN